MSAEWFHDARPPTSIKGQWESLRRKYNNATERLGRTVAGERGDEATWNIIKRGWPNRVCPHFEQIEDILVRDQSESDTESEDSEEDDTPQLSTPNDNTTIDIDGGSEDPDIESSSLHAGNNKIAQMKPSRNANDREQEKKNKRDHVEINNDDHLHTLRRGPMSSLRKDVSLGPENKAG